jgi:DNA-directed RNA polymerase subunit RPC12/RpoP
MYVICKKCQNKIPVAGRPSGSTSLTGVRTEGNVRLEGGAISFGDGGSISFGPGGSIGFGAPQDSPFACPKCGSLLKYAPHEILD